jgi:hypothetical protein
MKTKYVLVAIMIISGVITSCLKETTSGDTVDFIKSFECDFDVVVVGSVLVSDGSIIMVCRDMDEKVPGYLYKVDATGNKLWQKRMPAKNTSLWQVYDLPGNGFATIGYEDLQATLFEVCLFDDDGNLLHTKQIPVKDNQGPGASFTPVQMLKLSNGNYYIVGSLWDEFFITITNSSFDALSQTRIQMPRENYGFFPRGICEMPDSTVVISAGAFENVEQNKEDLDIFITRTDLDGKLKSQIQQEDSLHNESPNALLPMGNKMILITGRQGKFNEEQGTFVSYLNNYGATLCAGEINLVTLSSDGQFKTRQGIRNYPSNGLAMSARPTHDGGFILCGTVNQSNLLNIVSPTHIYLMKVDASGKYEWSKTFETKNPSFGVDAIQTSDGGFFVSGHEKSFNKYFNVIVIKTNANGNL